MLWKHMVIILHSNIPYASDIYSLPVDEKDQIEDSWQFPKGARPEVCAFRKT